MHQLMHSFTGHEAPPAYLDAVRSGAVATFCLFAGMNVATPAQLRDLNESLHRAAEEGNQPPPLIGIDQEGGQLIAIRGGATELPGNMALGATRSPELAEQAGRVLGYELRAMGLNLNFAPSVDVNVNPANPVVGTRSFGADPTLVAELGAAMIRGTQSAGVIATAKHFPGHGDIQVDTHHELPTVAHPMERIQAVELHPFRTAITSGVQAIMSAHILFPEMDTERPATISRAIMDGYLRRDMGFDGLIITDAMDMHAVAQFGAVNSVRMALEAGVDLALLGHLPGQLDMIEPLQAAARPASVQRIVAAQQRVGGSWPNLDVVGCAQHQQIAQAIADRSITLVRGAAQLPLRPGPEDTIAVITPQTANLTPADTSAAVEIDLAEAIRRRHGRTTAYTMPRNAPDATISAILIATRSAATVVMGTIAAEQDPAQAALVKAIHALGQRLIVVSLRTPYDLVAFPDINTYLCAYGVRPVTTEAIARVLFGEIQATGVLPCPIPGFA